jgi:hypothetical protein
MMIELNHAEHEQVTSELGVTGHHHPRAWTAFGIMDNAIIVSLLALSAFSILFPYIGRLGGHSMNRNVSWLLAAGLLLLLLVFVIVRRFQVINDQRLWQDAGCPQCFERELVRVPRKRSDRWYNLVALPAYRYACRNCTWQGLRISRRYYWSEPLVVEGGAARLRGGQTAGFLDSGRQTGDTTWSPADVGSNVAVHQNGMRPFTYQGYPYDESEVADVLTSQGDVMGSDATIDMDLESVGGDEPDIPSTSLEQEPTDPQAGEQDNELDWL